MPFGLARQPRSKKSMNAMGRVSLGMAVLGLRQRRSGDRPAPAFRLGRYALQEFDDAVDGSRKAQQFQQVAGDEDAARGQGDDGIGLARQHGVKDLIGEGHNEKSFLVPSATPNG